MKKIIICITAVVAAAALFAACNNPDSYIDNQDMNSFASVRITVPGKEASRALYKASDITGYRIVVWLLESDQKTVIRQEHDSAYYVEQFPVTIDKLSIGYTSFKVEAFRGNDLIAKQEVIKQLRQGPNNTLTVNLEWCGSDIPEPPEIPDEDEEEVEYDTSAGINLSLSIADEYAYLYYSRYDYYDQPERTVRLREPVILGQYAYIGDSLGQSITITYRVMASENRGPFQEVASGSMDTRNYIETFTVNTGQVGLYYYYVELSGNNGVRQQYVNSPLYKIRVLPPPPAYYREPLGITGVTRNTVNFTADEDAVLASVNRDVIAIRKNHNAVVSFAIAYEDSGYLADPRTEMPIINSSDNVVVVDTEINDSGVTVYYSALVRMPQHGVGYIECETSQHRYRSTIIAADEIIKDGDWVGAGRLTDFDTPAYPVNSLGAYKTKIIYLYGGQSGTNYAWSYINAFVNDDEEVDSFSFTSTSGWGSYSLITPHEFEFVSNFAPVTVSFKGRGGDHTAYLGFVFAYYE